MLFRSDSDGLIGAWGDARNLCSPPPSGAQAPCSPAGRPDQDVWAKEESPSDLAAGPLGYVTGAGPQITIESNATPGLQATSQTSRETEKTSQPKPTPPKEFQLRVPMAPGVVHQSLATYVASQGVSLLQNDAEKRLISSSAIPLTHDQLFQSITQDAQKLVPKEAVGKLFLTFRTTNVGTSASATSKVTVSTRILVVTSQDLDSPLGGRLVTSNGTIEQKQLNALSSMFELK